MQGEFIVAILFLIVIFNSVWKARRWKIHIEDELEIEFDSKKKEERFKDYMAHYHSVIAFTIHKDVSAETVRFLDSEARRLSDEIGGHTNYDKMMLEMEQDLNNGFDTGWWKE